MSASRYLLEVLLWVIPRCLVPFTLSYSRLPLPLTSRSRIPVLKYVRKWSNLASWRRNDGSVWLGCCAGSPDSLLGRRRTADRDAAIEQLGSMFPVSGPYADRVPQTLQRCSSRVLDKMGFLVGWRKGDACSFLSQTVGGHAIAVIMPFLSNVATENSYGWILSSLSEALLPSQICKSSSDQLCTACRLVANQTAMLDFPSVLASQTTRVRQVYLELDMDAPTAHLLDVLSTSWLHILLRCLSNSLRTSNTTTRIRGVAGQVWTLAFMMILCPHDSRFTVEGIEIHRGERQNVWLDMGHGVGENASSPKQFVMQQYSTIYENGVWAKGLVPLGGTNARIRLLKYRW